MKHKYCVETVERALRDVHNDSRPFGRISVVLGGDYRQILPVAPKGGREQIVSAFLRRSLLWGHVQALTLADKMRLDYATPENKLFAEFLMKAGSNPKQIVQLPLAIQNLETVRDLILLIYPRLNESIKRQDGFLTKRTILSARNDDVSSINDEALHMFPGESITYLAADKIQENEISLTPSTTKMPFQMTQRQFPIRLSYAMIINKSQGQSVKYVRLDLRTLVFSHGQLYVALSRCTSASRISVLPRSSLILFTPKFSYIVSHHTTNIVYPEVLL
ncbi:hypothetical protein GIB67_011535 [Kingdonia uniflora]|uniref:ATP-dependent DNA helicase n=1 Tax=Kingdonia uniflora TaxID=39325 RepID=A0A7J7NMA2_9MAGN|nr:hypothetical protein GIB67_011535 [Kingdonia uniflora]